MLLEIVITGEDTDLLDPSLKFECLKSLSVKSRRLKYDETNNISLIIADMISKHAEKLEVLKFDGVGLGTFDLVASDFSSLKNLILHDTNS